MGAPTPGAAPAATTAPLFAPLAVGGLTLPNRIVMPPMVQLRGLAAPEGVEWYREHAAGGPGLVIVEATAVNRFGTELTAGNLAPLVEAIHQGGALAAIQLFPVTFRREVDPAGLTREEIDSIVEEYGRAAEICLAAGFDGVEPHGAHGYVLNQFFSPEQNRRDDEYGAASLEDRMRLSLRIVEKLRPICGEPGLILYRHTPVGPGYGLADSLVLARRLVGAGVDILDISPSTEDDPGDLAAPFTGLGAPVIAVGKLDEVDDALEVLARGRADLCAVGRALIADPEWPNKIREGRRGDIVQCERCNEGCFGNLRRDEWVECVHAH